MSSIERAVVSKYQLYPKSEPNSYAVGFNVFVVGGEQFYIDTLVDLVEAEGMNSIEITDFAWSAIRDNALQRAEDLADRSSVIGRVVESRQPTQYSPWVQPGGAGDAYASGEKVTHNDYIWISLVSDNVWEPGVYGWRIIDTSEGNQEPIGDPEEETPPSGEDEGDYPEWQAWNNDPATLYQIGDRVSHNGSNWEANVGNNHWEPGVYGWDLI